MVVWALMTGAYENYGLRGIYADPLAALDAVDGEWREYVQGGPPPDGTVRWLNNEYIETAEVFAVEVEDGEYRGGHYLHVEESGYRATCAACQWRGEAKASRSAAERDWARHHPDRPELSA